jgi:hypothetical protein
MYLPYIAPVLLSFLLCVLVSVNVLRRLLSLYLQDTSALCDPPPCRLSSGSVVDVLGVLSQGPNLGPLPPTALEGRGG